MAAAGRRRDRQCPARPGLRPRPAAHQPVLRDRHHRGGLHLQRDRLRRRVRAVRSRRVVHGRDRRARPRRPASRSRGARAPRRRFRERRRTTLLVRIGGRRTAGRAPAGPRPHGRHDALRRGDRRVHVPAPPARGDRWLAIRHRAGIGARGRGRDPDHARGRGGGSGHRPSRHVRRQRAHLRRGPGQLDRPRRPDRDHRDARAQWCRVRRRHRRRRPDHRGPPAGRPPGDRAVALPDERLRARRHRGERRRRDPVRLARARRRVRPGRGHGPGGRHARLVRGPDREGVRRRRPDPLSAQPGRGVAG